jgi:hypothetical protein
VDEALEAATGPLPKGQQRPPSRRSAERPALTVQSRRAGASESVSRADPLAPGMVTPSTRRSRRGPQAPSAATARPRANTAVRPPKGQEFIYTVTCVHCGAAQETSSLELAYPRHYQRGRKNFICPWSNTRLSARQIRAASRRVVKKVVMPAATVKHPRPAQKKAHSAAAPTATTVSKKQKKPQTPSQRRGNADSSTHKASSPAAISRDTAARARRRARRYFTSEYGDIGDDRFRELGELNADSVSVAARLGPSQGTGRRR